MGEEGRAELLRFLLQNNEFPRSVQFCLARVQSVLPTMPPRPGVDRHLNRVLGSDFRVPEWRHLAHFNSTDSRIEMHLQADGAMTVRWPGGERVFADGERLHTENSYKWTPEAFEAMLREAGFGPATHWTDERGWFSVFWAPA